jgi:hypothetical protein
MFDHLIGLRPSDRKLRLVSVACTRRSAPVEPGPRAEERRTVTDVAERLADGLASPEELSAASGGWNVGAPLAADSVEKFLLYGWTRISGPGGTCQAALMAYLFRDVFGDLLPRRPPFAAGAALTPAVLSLAQAAYEERPLPHLDLDPVRLSVLADALTDAGCADDALTSHLRSAGPHVRGCWAVDLILGKQ